MLLSSRTDVNIGIAFHLCSITATEDITNHTNLLCLMRIELHVYTINEGWLTSISIRIISLTNWIAFIISSHYHLIDIHHWVTLDCSGSTIATTIDITNAGEGADIDSRRLVVRIILRNIP